jgi:DNA-directed RNA polymerase subunit beta'
VSTPEATWKELQTSAVEAVKTTFPIEGRNRSLVLNDVLVDEAPAQTGDIRGQEKAKENARTWGANIVADVSLVDRSTGKVIDRSRTKLFTLPKPTDRYSYIVDGSEWQVDNLWRLKPGVYSQIKANGELETEFALAMKGNVGGFARESRLKVPFNPENKKFKFRWGTQNTDLYSILKTLGVQDEDMKKAWGTDIYKANSTAKIEQDIRKLYDKVSKRGVKAEDSSYDAMATAIFNEFHNAALAPDTTKHTLGKPISNVTGEALLLASKRILDVAQGNTPPDDRNSLIFKKLVGVDDFLNERLTKPATQKMIRLKAGNNLERAEKVRDVISSDMFSKPVKSVFTSSSLAKNPEQSNPLEMLANYRSTTILGGDEGGIKNDRTLNKQMKLINPSHMGFLDPIHTPESTRTGISLNLPMGVTKDGNEARVMVYDLKEKKVREGKQGITPAELHAEYVLLPDQVKFDGGKPVPIADKVKMKDPKTGDIVLRPFKDAKYMFMSPHQLFDEATNLIPFLQNNQGNRTMTASRQASQAVGLTHREAPLVQVQGGKKTWEKLIGTPFSHTAPISGKIVAVNSDQTPNSYPDSIVIQGKDGKKQEVQLYNHFPLNEAKSFLHSVPKVSVGQDVKEGDLLADTNFTKDGDLALGTNLRVSYLPYKGYNFEDGIVISVSAAEKLTFDHVHRLSLEIDPSKDFMNKKKFEAYASVTAKKYGKSQLDRLDDDGVIRIGEKVSPGDLLVAAVGKREDMGQVGRIASRLDKALFDKKDVSVKWEGGTPGEVVKVQKLANGKGAIVHVRTKEPAEVGDKIVGRHGNKSIITQIIPNHEMPRIGSDDGDHVEVLMNPSGVPSRINLGQMLETAASKIARKTGKPYVVNNFGGADIDYTQKVKDDLKAAGVSDTEVLYDPATKRRLGDVLTGDQYIMKLKHQVEKKLAVRSTANYTLDRAPTGTGSSAPGQGIGQLEFYALLAHGARKNLREMATYKADQQVDDNLDPQAHINFWHRVEMGQPLPPPRPTFAYRKFEAYLKGLGVNVHKEGNSMQLIPLTDKGVLSMSNGEIQDPGRALRGKDAKELEKGLFDPKITGGLPSDKEPGKGLNWAHITLAKPVPNPVFVGTAQKPGPAVVLTGLKFDDFENIVKGKKEVDGKTGGVVIRDMLEKIDVKKELEKVKAELPTLRGSALNHANRKAKYLRALDNLNMKPSEAYIMNHVPVIPPVFRPIIPMQDGDFRFDDVNLFYKALGLVNNKLKEGGISELHGADQKQHEEMYDILKALMGSGGVPQYDSNRKLKGILDTIAGTTPKTGYFQKKIMKRRQELSMRSTIIPEPAMHLDYVGIPRSAAMELYKPFVLRQLKMIGRSPLEARKDINEETPAAWKALEKAIEDRPVLLKRDPALHKASIMAFRPKLVDGKAIRIHPLVTAGFNADFDGDTMSAYVPLTDDATREAQRMFPSNNLFSSTNSGIMFAPSQEALLGLHLLSKWGKDTNKKFSNFDQIKKEYDKGTITANDVVTVDGKKTTYGRKLIANSLPKEYQTDTLLHNPELVIAKKGTSLRKAGDTSEMEEGNRVGLLSLLSDLGKHDPKKFSVAVDRLKDIGNKHAYESGFSISLNDLHVHKEFRDPVLKKADEDVEKIKHQKGLSADDRDEKIIAVYETATKDIKKLVEPAMQKGKNNIYTMVDSGARGNWSQFQQMTIAPMIMVDGTGKKLANPVRKSYTEGLDVGDYWTALHGARMGTLQRAEGTSEPGMLTKDIINFVMPEMIVSKDCGVGEGISMDVTEDDIHDRLLAKPLTVNGKKFERNTIITPQLTSLLKKNGIKQAVVRSPLKCQHGTGMCAKCFGLNEDGREHEIGTNIGVIAGHSLGEPAMQLAMDSFHTGGVAGSRGAGATSRIGRLKELLNLPAKLPDSATLSRTNGRVDKIEKGSTGWNVRINGHDHFAPATKRLEFKGKPLEVGMQVTKGAKITSGPVNPRDLLPLTDIHTVQNHLVGELYDGIYKDERVRRRNIETVVRSLTNLVKIQDPAGTDYLTGDIVSRSVIEEHNRNLPAGAMPIKAPPVLKGMAQGVLDSQEDWLARLNFRRLKETVMEGAAKGWSTNLHGTHPVPAYAYGAEFGEGTKKEPWKY